MASTGMASTNRRLRRRLPGGSSPRRRRLPGGSSPRPGMEMPTGPSQRTRTTRGANTATSIRVATTIGATADIPMPVPVVIPTRTVRRRVARAMHRFLESSFALLLLMLSFYVIVAHWFACVFYVIGREDLKQGIQHGWLSELSNTTGAPFVRNITLLLYILFKSIISDDFYKIIQIISIVFVHRFC